MCGGIVLEQPTQVKCHLCGNAAEFAFAYARFSDREAFQGVILRGVCRSCLRVYIEAIKQDRAPRGELLLWPVVFLPIGALLAGFSRNPAGEILGYGFLGLAVVMPVLLRLRQRREAARARRATERENLQRYSEQMCREDALLTSRQTKLIYLCPAYAAPDATPAMIAREVGVTQETAALIQKLAVSAQTQLGAYMSVQD